MIKQHVWALIFIGIVCLPSFFLSTVPSFLTAQDKSGKVEIVIRNSTFEFQGGILQPNEPGTIVLRNLDKVKHGFTSPLLQELDVQVEADDATTYGKGIKGIYINPGQTVQIHFISNRPGRFPFHCDIHPNMKGELLLLAIGAT